MDNNNVYDYIRICYVNYQSLLAYIDEFHAFFLNSNYHMICLSETWLKPAIYDHMVSLPRYQLFRCDRIGKGGRGVALFTADFVRIKILATSGRQYYKKPEVLLAEISTLRDRIVLAATYRPPHAAI